MLGTVDTRSEIDHAIEVFVHGFGFVRSRTHPYLAERVGPAWVMRDAVRRDPKKYRTEEWVACGMEPAALARLAGEQARGRYALCVVRPEADDPAPIRQAYKALGYRLNTTEPFLWHRLADVPLPPTKPDLAIEQVTTPEQAERLLAAGGPKLPPEAFDPAGRLRQYVALLADVPVGWVASIAVRDGKGGAASTWCSDLYVAPDHRRRGIGRALMIRMLHDDRDQGMRCSVLSASHSGALLYPRVGYELLGELLVYTPVNRTQPEPQERTSR
jgi:GNAT superfamily N-acetyltransferase